MITIREGTLQEAMLMEQSIPEFKIPYDEEEYHKRLDNIFHIILIACDGEKIVGFKLGYALSDETFYSWLGGVIPDYRKKGIAKELLIAQENLVKENNYNKIRVRSRNKFPNMLHFLIKNKYSICGFVEKESLMAGSIRFVKEL